MTLVFLGFREAVPECVSSSEEVLVPLVQSLVLVSGGHEVGVSRPEGSVGAGSQHEGSKMDTLEDAEPSEVDGLMDHEDLLL